MAEPTQKPEQESWHLDKKVPIAIIVTMIAQIFLAGVAWSDLRNSLNDHERRITNGEATNERRDRELFGIGDRLARLETNVVNQLRILERMEDRQRGATPQERR